MGNARNCIVIALLLLGICVPAMAQPVCDIVYNGNEGTENEYSVRSARWHLNRTQGFLSSCAFVNGPPWDACQAADWHLNEADILLVQVFINATGFRCWYCDPGNRSLPGTLIAVAARVAQLSAMYEAQSRQHKTYENTVFNIESWLFAHRVYCEICDDGIDNDNDGLIDCADPDCKCSPLPPPEICNDGIDNDGDGWIDCFDTDCAGDPACTPGFRERICDDGIDNDGDGYVDCDDIDCTLDSRCAPSQPVWFRTISTINPNAEPEDAGWATSSERYVNRSSATESSLRNERKNVKNDQVLKHWIFEFTYDAPPSQLKAGDTITLTLRGRAQQFVGPSVDAEVCYGGIWGEGIGIPAKTIRLSYDNLNAEQTITFTVPDSLPQEFKIHAAIGGTAAHVVWIYRRQ